MFKQFIDKVNHAIFLMLASPILLVGFQFPAEAQETYTLPPLDDSDDIEITTGFHTTFYLPSIYPPNFPSIVVASEILERYRKGRTYLKKSSRERYFESTYDMARETLEEYLERRLRIRATATYETDCFGRIRIGEENEPEFKPVEYNRAAYYYGSAYYYSVTIEIGSISLESYDVSCMLTPIPVIRSIISGEINTVSNDVLISQEQQVEGEQTVADRQLLDYLKVRYAEVESVYLSMQQIQGEIDENKRETRELKDGNEQLLSEVINPGLERIKERLKTFCEAYNGYPLTDLPSQCSLVSIGPNSSVSVPSLDLPPTLRSIGKAALTEVIQYSANLLIDVLNATTALSSMRTTISTVKGASESAQSNLLIIESNETSISAKSDGLEKTAREEYFKFTSDIQSRESGVYDYRTDLSPTHNPVSILLYIKNDIQSRIQELEQSLE